MIIEVYRNAHSEFSKHVSEDIAVVACCRVMGYQIIRNHLSIGL